MTAHVSSFLLNLLVYAIDRSIESSCMYYIGGGGFCDFGGDFIHSTVEVRPERSRLRPRPPYLPLVNSGDNIFSDRDFHLPEPSQKENKQ